jgi:hypothetical protein
MPSNMGCLLSMGRAGLYSPAFESSRYPLSPALRCNGALAGSHILL